MRTTLLGSLLDVARHNVARGAGDLRAVRVRAGLPRRRRGRRSRLPRRAAARSARCCTGQRSARRPGATADAAARRLLRRQGRRSSAVLDALRRRLAVEPGARPFLHPGRGAAVVWPATSGRAGRRAASARRARAGTSSGAGGVRARPRRASRDGRRGSRRYEDLTHVPGRAPGHRGRRAGRRARGTRSLDVVRARGRRRCCARGEVFDVYRGEQVGEGKQSLALRARVPRARPHATDEEVAAAARARSSTRCATSSGASCVAERRSVIGARGLRAARWPRACCRRHPRFELAARDARAATPAARLDDLYPRHRVPLELEELDLERHGARRRGDRRLSRTAPRRPWSPRCARAGVRVVDLTADFRLRDRGGLRALVRRRTGRPSCSTRPSSA